jgi:hypothetical protein
MRVHGAPPDAIRGSPGGFALPKTDTPRGTRLGLGRLASLAALRRGRVPQRSEERGGAARRDKGTDTNGADGAAPLCVHRWIPYGCGGTEPAGGG